MIPVTKPFFPPLEEYYTLLEDIWAGGIITNNGPLVKELEKQLAGYLSVDNVLFLSNGTIALQIAIKALGLQREIITTPFSYVATTSSIVWEACKPVFVDIDEDTLNINPGLIEDAITEHTTAILATHVFGNPCDVEAIQNIASRHNLKIIYDAAHCFGVRYKGRSIFSFGDVTATSFHATKLFHTIEGGAVFTTESELFERMRYMRNFGHDGPEKFNGLGINGKNSELHAAMGLLNLARIHEIMDKRREQSLLYDKHLAAAPLRKQVVMENTSRNFSYYPVMFNSEQTLLNVKNALEKEEIFPRRYFYPGLNTLDYADPKSLPKSDFISKTTLCLPLYHELSENDIKKICMILSDSVQTDHQ